MKRDMRLCVEKVITKWFDEDTRVINRYLKKKKKERKRKKLVEKLAYNIWRFYGCENGKEIRDWKEAEDFLATDFRRRHIASTFETDSRRRRDPISIVGIGSFIIIIISSLIALILHLLRYGGIQFDNYSIILFVLVLIPFLSFIFEKATLPGGWNLEFRKIQRQQRIQSQEIENIRFLFFHFVSDYEKEHLRKLNSSNRFAYEFRPSFEEELRRLLALELIDRHPARGIRSAQRDTSPGNDLKEHFYITDKGKDYLARLDRFDEDLE